MVEDEPLIALDMADALERFGHNVAVAFNQHDALDLIEEFDFDVAILDYALGDGDCLPLSDWLVDHGIPFVIATGHKEVEVNGSARRGSYLSKPFRESSLLSAVDNLRSAGKGQNLLERRREPHGANR